MEAGIQIDRAQANNQKLQQEKTTITVHGYVMWSKPEHEQINVKVEK